MPQILPDNLSSTEIGIDVYEGGRQNYSGDDLTLYRALHDIWEREVEHLMPSGHSYTESWEAVPDSIRATVDLAALATQLKWPIKHLIAIFGHLEKDHVARIVKNIL